MAPKTHTIELDEETALSLRAQAHEQGLSASELVAQMVSLHARPVKLSDAEVKALDRQWAAIKAGEPTVPHDQVKRWLRSWGSADFKLWRDQ